MHYPSWWKVLLHLRVYKGGLCLIANLNVLGLGKSVGYRFPFQIHAFFISNTFINNTKLKLVKNQTKAKEQPKKEPLLFQNYLLSSSTWSTKTNRVYSKKCANSKCVCFNETILIIMKIKINMKKRSHRYDMETNMINIYIMCLGMMMPLCIKQHLSNIWSSNQEKIKQSSGWVEKKALVIKKRVLSKDLPTRLAHLRVLLCQAFTFFLTFLLVIQSWEYWHISRPKNQTRKNDKLHKKCLNYVKSSYIIFCVKISRYSEYTYIARKRIPEVFLYNFMCQNVLISRNYLLLTRRINKFWNKNVGLNEVFICPKICQYPPPLLVKKDLFPCSHLLICTNSQYLVGCVGCHF